LITLEKVLTKLESNGFTINPSKCEWAVQETDWLGYWLTPAGLKPWSKKIQAVVNMAPPKNLKQLRSFLGSVTFYRDMWPRCSHTLAPLTELTGKKKFIWTDVHQQAFDAMKALMVEDALLCYPDHNRPFHIYTDASDYQLGAVILQRGVPVAYYSRKLTPTQRNYTVIEKELLSVIETLREFRSMLLGAELHVYTDHRNLTHNHLNTQRVLRWRLYLEDFHPTFHYVRGSDNLLADALSRIPQRDSSSVRDNHLSSIEKDESIAHAYSIICDDESLLECFLHHPFLGDELTFPLDYNVIYAH